MAEIVPSMSRYLRKLGVKKALQGRLGPCCSWVGCLMWWTRLGMIPSDKGTDLWILTERQVRLCLCWELPSPPALSTLVWAHLCSSLDLLWVLLPGVWGQGGQKHWLWLMFGHWDRAGEVHLVPSARTVGAKGSSWWGPARDCLEFGDPGTGRVSLWGAESLTLP